MNKFYSFGYYDWDFALYAQTMWSLTHGSLTPSLFGVNFLANHANYIAFIIAPIYFIFQHPLTLIILKILSHVISAYVLYLIGKQKIGNFNSILLLIAYFLYPANIYALLFEFDFEALAPPLVIFMYFSFINKKHLMFVIFMILTSLCKENLASLPLMFGIYAFFLKGYNKIFWSLIPIIFSIIYFYVVMFILLPHYRNHLAQVNSIYFSLFSHLGENPHSLLQNFIKNPIPLLKFIMAPINIIYLSKLFYPLLLTPLISPQILLLVFPLFMQNLLSSTLQLHTIYYHYSTVISVFVFLASLETLTRMSKYARPFFINIFTIIILLTIVLTLPNHSNKFAARTRYTSNDIKSIAARWRMVEQIPQQASVIASFTHLPPLTQRRNIYAFYNIFDGQNFFIGQKFTAPKDLEYAFLNLNDPWLADQMIDNPDVTRKNLADFFYQDDWRIIDAYKQFVLLKKHGQGPKIFDLYPDLYGIDNNRQ